VHFVLFAFVDSKWANVSSSNFKTRSVNQTVREGVIQSVINPMCQSVTK